MLRARVEVGDLFGFVEKMMYYIFAFDLVRGLIKNSVVAPTVSPDTYNIFF